MVENESKSKNIIDKAVDILSGRDFGPFEDFAKSMTKRELKRLFTILCRKDNENAVQFLLSRFGVLGVGLHTSPLHEAARNGSGNMIAILSKSGMSANWATANGLTPLMAAVIAGDHIQACALLIQCSANIDARDSDGRTALMHATIHGRLQCIELLVQHSTLELYDKFLKGALHYAIENDDMPCLRILASHANSRAQSDPIQFPPLNYAAQLGNTEALITILEGPKGNPTFFNASNRSPCFTAAQTGHATTLQSLGQNVPTMFFEGDVGGSTPLHAAANHGHAACVKIILDHPGCDPNMLDSERSTALQCAARSGSLECVKELLSRPCRLETDSPLKQNALGVAVAGGFSEIAEEILKNFPGALIHRDVSGFTPLHEAARVGSPECVKVLLKRGAEVNIQSLAGYTPLHCSGFSGSVECAELLLRGGASVQKETRTGETALHQAAETGSVDLVRLLIKAKVNVNVKCSLGFTALARAINADQVECARVLVDAQASTKDGPYHTTLVGWAAYRGALKCFTYLIDTVGLDPLGRVKREIHAPILCLDEMAISSFNGQRMDGADYDGIMRILMERTPEFFKSKRWLNRCEDFQQIFCMAIRRDLVSVLEYLREVQHQTIPAKMFGKSILFLSALPESMNCFRFLVQTLGLGEDSDELVVELMKMHRDVKLIEVLDEVAPKAVRHKTYDRIDVNRLFLDDPISTCDALTDLVGTDLYPAAFAAASNHPALGYFLDHMTFTPEEASFLACCTCFSRDNVQGLELVLEKTPVKLDFSVLGGWTPLYFAALYDRPGIIRRLLKEPRASIINEEGDWQAALMLTRKPAYYGPGMKDLFESALKDESRNLHDLISNVAKYAPYPAPFIDMMADRGVTECDAGMVAAIAKRDVDLVQQLVYYGFDFNKIYDPSGGEFPLIQAVKAGSDFCTEVLRIVKDFSVECCDADGISALHWAVIGGEQTIVGILVFQGANINTQDSQGRSLLHTCVNQDNMLMLHILLKIRPPDPRLVDRRGETALHYAAAQGKHLFTEALLSCQAPS